MTLLRLLKRLTSNSMTEGLSDRLLFVLKSSLARNTGWAFTIRLGQLCMQALFFILAARAFGADGYGEIVSTLVPVVLLTPFASMGLGHTVVRQTSRQQQSFLTLWGNAVLTTTLIGGALSVAIVFLGPLLIPGISQSLFLFISLSELMLAQITRITSQLYQGFDQLAQTAPLLLIPPVSRIVALAIVWLIAGSASPVSWSAIYFALMVLVTGLSVAHVVRRWGFPALDLRSLPSDLRSGFPFATSHSAEITYAESDKVMLARLTSLEVTGAYAAGHRIVTIALAPIQAVLFATYGRFFQHGQLGARRALAYARPLLIGSAAISLVAGAMIWVFAAVAPRILGPEFGQSVTVARWLAPFPFLVSIYAFGQAVLTASDRQGRRAAIQIVAAALNVSLNILLIRHHGMMGAVWATLITESALVLLVWGNVAFVCVGERRASTAGASQKGGG